MIYGYARVSSAGQTLEAQIEALKAAGCEKIYREKKTGRDTDRPQFQKMMAALQPGDLVLTTFLDRLSRDLTDILVTMRSIEQAGANYKSLGEKEADTTSALKDVFFAIWGIAASMHRKRIVENTTAGRIRAIERGQHMGRPPALTQQQQAEARQRRKDGASVRELALSYNVGKSTIARVTQEATI
jgi:DNA invertase Pin-like site-specific DNA recombinase